MPSDTEKAEHCECKTEPTQLQILQLGVALKENERRVVGGGGEGRVYSTGGFFFLDFIYYYLSDRKDTQYC